MIFPDVEASELIEASGLIRSWHDSASIRPDPQTIATSVRNVIERLDPDTYNEMFHANEGNPWH